MPHPLVLSLYPSPSAAAAGARAAHGVGVPHDRISVVSRNHDEDTALAAQMDATPGAELEDSRAAGRLGELSGYVLAAIALVLPGLGSIVAAGPLSAGLGEAAGHVAGGLASALTANGVDEDRALAFQNAVKEGAVLIAVHTDDTRVGVVRTALEGSGATVVETANWTP
jgi:uncharacterized membrane protein